MLDPVKEASLLAEIEATCVRLRDLLSQSHTCDDVDGLLLHAFAISDNLHTQPGETTMPTDPMQSPEMAAVILKNIAANLRGDLTKLTHAQMLHKLQVIQSLSSPEDSR